MDFVTIHDLSRELNIPARVIRYRFLNLIAEGKLKEYEDFRRDDFKDEQHFVWKINPLSFIRETKSTPQHQSSVTNTDNHPLPAGNKLDNQSPLAVNEAAAKLPPVGNEASKVATEADTESQNRSLAREMIDLLKDQVRVKDGQIKDMGEQIHETHELNLKLTGTMLQQAQKIENLLRLTGGKSEMGNVVNPDRHSVNTTDNQNSPMDNKPVNDANENNDQIEITMAL